MTMTLSMSASPGTVSSGGETEVSVVVSNSSGTAINLIELRTSGASLQRTAMALSSCKIPVPASGSITIKFKVQLFEDNQSVTLKAFSDDGQVADGSTSIIVT